ncbi:MAG: tetratricopeptide repeat protein [Polyangiales bacterium]
MLDIGSPIVAPAASWVPRPESPQSSPQSTAGTLDFLREEARRRLEREGDRRPAIAALVRLAHALVDAGLDDEALAASRRARDLLQGEPTLDPVLTASTLAAVALSEWACGDSAAAAEHLDRAISLHTSAGFEVPAGWLNLCAHLALERLDLDAAERAYAESLAIARRLLDAHGDSPQALRDLSVSLDNVGQVQQARGDLDAAERAFAESLATRRRLVAVSRPLQQDLSDLMSTLSALANLHRERGHGDVAASLEQERDALKERLSHPPLSP